jgi:hypothetical protein
MAKMKPKGARGRAQVRRLGRTYKTGGFARIAAKSGGGAKGQRIAGAIFQRMARARKG